MEGLVGLLRIRVKRGTNLARRDSDSSDPYVVITMGSQTQKTSVVQNRCSPVWNEELTFSMNRPYDPVKLTVYDKDTFSSDDEMGIAQIDIMPFIEVHQLGLRDIPDGTVIKSVLPTRDNFLSEESRIISRNGKIQQDMILRLRNVECGDIDIQLDWI